MNIDDKLIYAITHFFTRSVSALDKSTSGWWKFSIIFLIVWFCGSIYQITNKIDPNKLLNERKPKHDCVFTEFTRNCER